ncbi:D-alanyl-D-alanine carboxypeptidase family protein [Aequorivita sp. H23M31]|uniref:D-alanyl-D-alanine carboxypeptidase family protein n=1 Tax=Aequorivita ciconiae TaxID=2494375 RepID=A0A410G1M2_9FLAO|nr:M15 family metallopeptidase [Aequorivita sp. H23M31]QAA81163.1 D-alanyl-D-alanine carboxypeptidase family protein [Aequorivita sp. H23M31]
MKRHEFIKISGLAGLGVAIFPNFSFKNFSEEFTRNQLIGKGNPDIIGDSYTSKMNKLTKEAFNKMKVAAAKENINLEVVSAYRSFQRQKEIFEGKYRRFTSQGLSPENAIEKIIEYSTIPGTSRHHWGTDLDIIDANAPRPANVLMPENFHGLGPYCNLKVWLDKNAHKFDFIEVYTDNGNRKGFRYEPWHFSYAPVSIPMLREYQQKIDVKKMLSEEKILGNEFFSEAFVDRYVKENILDINPKLL